jgi:hypothetical protein
MIPSAKSKFDRQKFTVFLAEFEIPSPFTKAKRPANPVYDP